MKHRVKHIHFVGIGGVGMSGIAEVLLTLVTPCPASDMADSATTRRLVNAGAKVYFGHDAGYIAGADVVVTSTAVKADNPEVLAAEAARIPVVPPRHDAGRADALQAGHRHCRHPWQQTTTTSLVASVLGAAGLDPTFVIGGRLEPPAPTPGWARDSWWPKRMSRMLRFCVCNR